MAKVRVIDFETTGFEPPAAQVCEAGYCDVDTDTRTVSPEYHSWLCGITGPMPPGTRAVHHISAEDSIGLGLTRRRANDNCRYHLEVNDGYY